MPSRASKRKDFTQIAKVVFDAAIGEGPKPVDPDTPTKSGASKGGQARAKKLPAQKRSEIAKKAAKKRWGRALTSK